MKTLFCAIGLLALSHSSISQIDSTTIYDHYQALFDTTQSQESFLENLIVFREDLRNATPTDSSSLIFNNGSNETVYFDDSLLFQTSSWSSWSGAWGNSSATLFFKGRPIYFVQTDLFEISTQSFIKDTLIPSDSSFGISFGEFYNFWTGKKVTYRFEYSPKTIEWPIPYNVYQNHLFLNENIKIERIIRFYYEPIDPDHILKWYFENNLEDRH